VTDIRDRLADVMQQHLVCDCGEWAEDWAESCVHLADVVVSELGLTEEQLALGVCGWTNNPLEGLAYIERQTRYVTPWAPAEVVEVPSPPDTREGPWPGDAVQNAWR
jgi:hypothetical protein